MISGWFADATAGTASGEAARAVDWAATSLGPVESWPVGLRTAVELCFSTRFPVLVTWGPELVMIYNDGYRELLGSGKHPSAMGAPVLEVWDELAETITPLFDSVLETGRPTWVSEQRLVMHRSGYDEEAYFAYSYSALRDEAGVVRGVLDITTEMTDAVVDRRRLSTLGSLSGRLQAAVRDVAEVGRLTAEVLGPAEDLRAATVYLRDGDDLLLLATTRARPYSQVLVGKDVLHRVADSLEAEEHGAALVAPLLAAGDESSAGVIVLEASPLRPFDTGYRNFLDLVAGAVGAAMSSAVRHVKEVGELRRVSETLQLSMVTGVGDLPGVVVRYLPAVGSLSVGGDWYDVVTLDENRTALLVGDCVGHDLAAATVMGQLRSASRALLLDRQGPAGTLEGLDRFAHVLRGAECTTVFCAVVDTRAKTVTYSSAGHPPPLVVGERGSTWLTEGRGLPLAVLRDRRRPETTAPLRDGDTLLLYTDGLIERRAEHLGRGMERLRTVAASAGVDGPLGMLADGVLDRLLPTGPRDDVAMLLYRLQPSAAPAAPPMAFSAG